MELLEPESSQRVLDDVLNGAAAGGRMVLLAGNAGTGAGAQLREFRARHGSDARIWRARCTPLGVPHPLEPFHQLAVEAGGQLAETWDDDLGRYERFSSVLDALDAPGQPAVVIIEDAHLADELSCDLLVFLARRLADTSAVVMVTYRDDELEPAHPLRRLIDGAGALPAVRRLVLPPRPSPAGRDTVLAELAGVSAAARSTLEALAVLSGEAETALVEALADDGGIALRECAATGLVEDAGEVVRFRDEVTYGAVDEALPAIRRRHLHGRALACLSAQPGTGPARLAHHAVAAGDADAVLRYAPAAAEQAARLGSRRAVRAHLAHATDHARHSSGLGPAERAELLERYAMACDTTDVAEECRDAAGEALALQRELGDVEGQARLLVLRADALRRLSRTGEARALATEAITLLEERPAGPVHAQVYARVARWHLLTSDLPGAAWIGSEAIALAEKFDDGSSLVVALTAAGEAQWHTEPDRAEALLSRALELSQQAGDDEQAASALITLGVGAGEARQYAVADRWLREAADWCAERDLDDRAELARAWSARSAFEQARWAEASATAGAVVRTGLDAPDARIAALTVLGRLGVRRGDPRADVLLGDARQLAAGTGELRHLWPVAAGQAEAAWLVGYPERIPDLVEEVYGHVAETGDPWAAGELASWLWRADALDTVPEHAALPYERQLSGDWQSATAAWNRLGCPYEAAFTSTDGEDPDALRAAADVFARLGAIPISDITAAWMRELGIGRLSRRTAPASPGDASGLTYRELEVLALLADGHADLEIAAQLHVTPKLAAHHVSSILSKLEADTPDDAVRVARERGLMPRDDAGESRLSRR